MRIATSALLLSVSVVFAAAGPSNLRPALTTSTEAGKNLLENARLLQGDDNGADGNENYDYSNWYADKRANNYRTQSNWLLDYNIKFEGCSTQYIAAGDGMERKLLANFRLCPTTGTCAFCKSGGEYVVDMDYFVQAYKDIAMNDKACRYQQEECYEECLVSTRNQAKNTYVSGDYGNGDYYGYGNSDTTLQNCEASCMNDAGMAYCDHTVEQNGNQGYNDNWRWDMQAMVQCRRLDYYGGNAKPYWVGATCRNGGVYLDTFTDSACSHTAAKGTFETLTGQALPTQNLVSSDCLACNGFNTYQRYQEYNNFQNYQYQQKYGNQYQYQNGEQDQQQNQDQMQQEDDPEYEYNHYENVQQTMGVCQQLYQFAGKCETNMNNALFKDTSGCDLIKRLEHRSPLAVVATIVGCLLLFGGVGAAGYLFYTKKFSGFSYTRGRKTSPALKSLDEPLTHGDETETVMDDMSDYQGGMMAAEKDLPPAMIAKLDEEEPQVPFAKADVEPQTPSANLENDQKAI